MVLYITGSFFFFQLKLSTNMNKDYILERLKDAKALIENAIADIEKGYCKTQHDVAARMVTIHYQLEHVGNEVVNPGTKPKIPVLQDWVTQLTFMQQSVLIAAVRGPDGIRKDHDVKKLMRWLRRSFLICAFDKVPHNTPHEPCGGSFTGPLEHGTSIYRTAENYLRYVDELPHHFQLHFMHAAEIIGYKHPIKDVREFWAGMYWMIAEDAHLHIETEEEMDARLSDNEASWRAREVVTAK